MNNLAFLCVYSGPALKKSDGRVMAEKSVVLYSQPG
jgi:hypothetical protein